MFKFAFKDPEIIARVAENPLGKELESFATLLLNLRYNRKSICQYLRKLEAFGWWLEHQGIPLEELSPMIVQRYLLSAKAESKLNNKVQRKSATSALSIFTRNLREEGRIAWIQPPPETELAKWIRMYDEHMQNVQGLARETRRQKLRLARIFLSSASDNGKITWSKITADSISQFILSGVAGRKGTGPQKITASVRGLVRFFISHSVLPACLEYAIPRTRRWSHATVPRRLSKADVKKIVKCNKGNTPIKLRNFAILLLLLRLGLRASEVNKLELKDIVWKDGAILLRAGKAHCERKVPLPEDVGMAIVQYLRVGRPKADTRRIFVTHSAPFSAFKNSSAIWHITRKSIKIAEINCPSGGAHMLRHTAASLMVNEGASFKDVADVLGHKQLHTTAVYAKLNVHALAAVALPWPGANQ
jgi:site-specific recombinase XerD